MDYESPGVVVQSDSPGTGVRGDAFDVRYENRSGRSITGYKPRGVLVPFPRRNMSTFKLEIQPSSARMLPNSSTKPIKIHLNMRINESFCLVLVNFDVFDFTALRK